MKPAPVDASIAGVFEGGPMGALRIEARNGCLTTSLELLPDYQYCLMEADTAGTYPLRSLKAPERWWGKDDKVAQLVLSQDGDTITWQNMWFGECKFHRKSISAIPI